MILKIFSVFDTAVGAFITPFFMSSRGQALRAFADTAKDPQSSIAKHPHDYALFELGTFDDSNAQFDLLLVPLSLGLASETFEV